jgi:hypothetical protein
MGLLINKTGAVRDKTACCEQRSNRGLRVLVGLSSHLLDHCTFGRIPAKAASTTAALLDAQFCASDWHQQYWFRVYWTCQ